MSLVQIDWKPNPRALREFGVAMLVGFAIIALILEFVLDARPAAMVCLAIGGVTGILGLTGTKFALPFYLLWMGIAFVLGNIISRVLVGLFYFGMITPYGLVMRLFGRDKLQLKGGQESYWHDMKPITKDNYERQF